MNMVGCSDKEFSSWISVKGSGIHINGVPVKLVSFNGTEGMYIEEDNNVRVVYRQCVNEIRDCTENTPGIHEDDLSTFKDSKYFDAYLDTFSCMHMKNDSDSTKEATITLSNKVGASLEDYREGVYKTLAALKFGPIDVATYSDCIDVKSNGKVIELDSTTISIDGVLKVGRGRIEPTYQGDINGVTVLYREEENYTAYQHGPFLITVTHGYYVNDYITLRDLGSPVSLN